MMNQTTLGVWEVFSQPLRSYIVRRVREQAEAEDILQEVFLKIHTRLNTLRDEEKLAAWLYRIAKNAITDHYRDKQGMEYLPGKIDVECEGGETDVSVELAARMRYFINACLPRKYAQALVLADLEGRTQQEVAALLDLSLSGAKARVQRARRLLREAFLRCYYVEFDGRKRVISYTPRPGCSSNCDVKGGEAKGLRTSDEDVKSVCEASSPGDFVAK